MTGQLATAEPQNVTLLAENPMINFPCLKCMGQDDT
jgi:hypothetical protein